MTSFLTHIQKFIPKNRLYRDSLRRLAWGTDAGFYRLIPQVIMRSENESEVAKILEIATREKVPVTFRAAGTSLSGQSISDSVLVVAGKNWEKYSVSRTGYADGETVTLQPGIIGARVNQILKPYGRKLGPDPASIKSAMIGGIVMNNASGMNCGTHANSDQVLLSARMILADGTVLDTGNKESCENFINKRPEFLGNLEKIRQKVIQNPRLVERIRKKYAIKNVMGLNLLPLVRFSDPFKIMAHLLVGSEGTLAFLSEVTMKTVPDLPFKASAMLYFHDMHEASRAVVAMKNSPVYSAEMLDKLSLAAAKDVEHAGMTAVLTETVASTHEELLSNIQEITDLLQSYEMVDPVRFTENPEEYAPFWNIRAGIFPAVGGMREPGSTCLIEDVAFPIENLPEATHELELLLARHGYHDACIYGHALEGNYHFILNQKFDSEAEIARYESMMEDVIKLVVGKYDGSLKAEHGTGRNMAPFVSVEWGEELYGIMKEIKNLFDPQGILNPGVIFNDDPKCYLKNLKPLPLADTLIDRCIECGFCEVNCMSCGFTLSSRQRIVIQREISRLEAIGDEKSAKVAQELRRAFYYPGNQTCAGDGLCSMSCPMGINVGNLTHKLRERELPPGSAGYRVGKLAARHFSSLKTPIRLVLKVADLGRTVLGTRTMSAVCRGLHHGSGKLIPLWTPSMPRAYKFREKMVSETEQKNELGENNLTVVYFPSCINQTFGTQKHAPNSTPLAEKTVSLLKKAGYNVVFPKNAAQLCCGTIWESKGMPDLAEEKVRELEKALWEASSKGKFPVLCDQSPCLHRMRECIKSMKLYEPVEFINEFLVDRLEWHPTTEPIAIHITCSTKRMKLDGAFLELARRCSDSVLVPENINCCGFAGDRGFTLPEVNAWALRALRPQLEEHGIRRGFSNSRTCEIGLTTNGGIPYESIIYLVDEVTTAKNGVGE
ncbi:MAG: FAD-binding and (Fe-S)-binding domain-containing protein [Planctomycetia bacterium]|nr:FAD-binding and (Fe-S)-binding domain-containing protein [Planctomycetia bacterium]